MSSRSTAAELVRLLHDLIAPVCVFDENRRLVFANQICADWAGTSLDQLIGQIGSYTSSETQGTQTAVNHLCPPPDAFVGRRQAGVVYAVSSDGELRRRHAEFLPLNGGSDSSSTPVLVVCRTVDLIEEQSSRLDDAESVCPASNDAKVLHDRVAHFRHGQSQRYRLDRLIGDSPAMQLARFQAQTAITARAGVTIVGPPGSGREHLARTIYYSGASDVGRQSDERQEKLLPLDGSLLTDEVLASAASGLRAQGRDFPVTVLLLNVDRLPMEIQPEIVRVLLQRFRGTRFLATSEVLPDALVAQERLHPQLALPMSTLVIRLPSLIERREDIPVLAQLFVEEHNSLGGKQLRGFAAEAIDLLVAYTWPGNVSQLRGFVGEAFARALGVEIAPADLPGKLLYAARAARRPTRAPDSIVLEDFLAEIERELIERALKQSKGNKAHAARLLGLTRPRLYRRMLQLGLEEALASEASSEASLSGTNDATRFRSKGRRDEPIALPSAIDEEENVAAMPTNDAEFIEDIPFEEQPE